MLDLQRAAKIAAPKPDLDVEAIDIQIVDNGFIVNCQHKQPESEGNSVGPWMPGKKYVFEDAKAALAFVTKKLTGAAVDDYEGEDIPAEEA